jgi:hypothetical protein
MRKKLLKGRKDMNILKFAKPVAGLVISMSVGAVVQNAISITTPATQNLIQKMGVKIGGYVVSSMVADHAVRYSFDEFEKFRDLIREGMPGDVIQGDVVDDEKEEA